jgi:predicted amidohydrolase
MASKVFKAGLIQFDVRLGDVEANLSSVKRRLARLADRGMNLVLLPEMWSTGFANDRLGQLAETTPGVLDQLCQISREMGVAIIGSMPEKRNGGIYNAAYVVDRDGSVLKCYRKIHLFSPTKEDRFFLPGREAVVVKTSLGSIGLMICYDLRFPELCRSLVLKGAQMVAVVAQWPAVRVVHWDVLLRARAIENQVFVFGVNRCGRDGDLVYGGHSRIVSPRGEALAKTGKKAASLTATVDLSHIEKVREQIPCLRERVPQAYG